MKPTELDPQIIPLTTPPLPQAWAQWDAKPGGERESNNMENSCSLVSMVLGISPNELRDELARLRRSGKSIQEIFGKQTEFALVTPENLRPIASKWNSALANTTYIMDGKKMRKIQDLKVNSEVL